MSEIKTEKKENDGILVIDGITYWSNKKVADFFKVTTPTLAKWRAKGLKYFRVGKGHIRYPETSTRKFFEENISSNKQYDPIEILPSQVAELMENVEKLNEEMKGTGLGDDKENIERV